MGTGLLQSLTDQKVVHGVVTGFERISSSADEAKYIITLEPFLALLNKQFHTHRFFVNQSVPDVVAQILIRPGNKEPTYWRRIGMKRVGSRRNFVIPRIFNFS
jgi:type VI secretion system secreted protein VgrG